MYDITDIFSVWRISNVGIATPNGSIRHFECIAIYAISNSPLKDDNTNLVKLAIETVEFIERNCNFSIEVWVWTRFCAWYAVMNSAAYGNRIGEDYRLAMLALETRCISEALQ